MIPREKCETGMVYLCQARNLSCAVWNGEQFVGVREKWGQKFLDGEFHWDDGAPYGTCKPLQDIGKLPLGMGMDVHAQGLKEQLEKMEKEVIEQELPF